MTQEQMAEVFDSEFGWFEYRWVRCGDGLTVCKVVYEGITSETPASYEEAEADDIDEQREQFTQAAKKPHLREVVQDGQYALVPA